MNRVPLKYKDHHSSYRNFNSIDRTVVRLSYLDKGNSFTGNMVSLHWNCHLRLSSFCTAKLITNIPEISIREVTQQNPGPWFNIKMSSYQYRDSRVKDKTVSPTVLSLTWESPYLGKTVFTLNRGPRRIQSIPGNRLNDGNKFLTTSQTYSAKEVYESIMTHWAPSQYKDRLSQVWGFPC